MHRPSLRFSFFASLLAVLASGCSAAGAGSGSNSAVPYAASGVRATAASVMYVASFSGIGVYDVSTGAFEKRILKKVDIPVAIVVDRAGTIYTANGAGGPHGQGAIEEFAKSGQFVRTITAGLNGPFALALDSKGNLYAANQYGKSVTVYAFGSGSLLRSITANVDYPIALEIDGADNVYVANGVPGYPGWVTEYAAGTDTALRTITAGINLPLSFALDGSGNLYVANDFGHSVTVYQPGSTTVWKSFRRSLRAPQTMAFDAAGALWVANYDGSVHRIDVQSGKTTATIQTNMAFPHAMAFDPSGNLVVVSHGQGSQKGLVQVYDPATGTRLHRITKNVLSPLGLAFGTP